MNIGLIDIDSKIPNLALKKLERYYLDQGATVVWNNLSKPNLDKVYVSVIFTSSRQKVERFLDKENYEIGGTGFSLDIELPKEVYQIKPRINMDFATRGCIRKCKFCVVPHKEGKIVAERDLYDIWDGSSKEVLFLDNNILALPEHFKLICQQAQKEKVKIDFNQGLDIRLVNEQTAQLLNSTMFSEIRFALDHVSLIPLFDEKLVILRKYLPKKEFQVYVLGGFNSTEEDELYRLNYLKANHCRPYFMCYDNSQAKSFKRMALRRWSNNMRIFRNMTFEEFIKFEYIQIGETYKRVNHNNKKKKNQMQFDFMGE